MTSRPISEEDLHGFVDGVLSPERLHDVNAYLADHPDVAARVSGYAAQRDTLRAALAPIAEEPLPPQLDLARIVARHRRPALPRWAMAAAAVVLLSLGAAGGWTMRGGFGTPEGIVAVAQEAADNYAVYAPDKTHPVELRAADRAELADWTTQQLGRPVGIPDLTAAGYRFMGGRVVGTGHGPAAMYMYDNDHGIRLVMLARVMKDVDRNAPMRPHIQGAVSGFAWADDGLGYSLVGPAQADKLHPIADEVRRQMQARSI
ncbi:MAG: anti-sigma factor [Tardiphaga sp.]